MATKPKLSFSEQLREETAAVRIHHEKFGIRRSLTDSQISVAAEVFDADPDTMSASKKLLDTRNPAYRKVVNVKTRATQYWKAHTVPYPEPGIRLIRRSLTTAFHEAMAGFRAELTEAVRELDLQYHTLRNEAQGRLGALYNGEDYPDSLLGMFSLGWDFPAVEPPEYLAELNPALYEREQQRVAERFEEALRLTEEAFTAELSKLVTHLVERLKGENDDGKPKIFRDSAVGNLMTFFDKFRDLNIRSDTDLETAVQSVETAVAGVDVKSLRSDDSLRTQLAASLGEVQSELDAMMVNKPKRSISFDDE